MDKASDRLTVPRRLASLEPGTRLRLFHLQQGKRAATSGALIAVEGGGVRIATDDGVEASIVLATITHFYVPPGSRPARPTQADHASFVDRARRAIAGFRRPRSGAPRKAE